MSIQIVQPNSETLLSYINDKPLLDAQKKLWHTVVPQLSDDMVQQLCKAVVGNEAALYQLTREVAEHYTKHQLLLLQEQSTA